MTARILDGAAIAKAKRRELALVVEDWRAADRRPPGLGVILVGDDPASEAYVRGKQRDCDEVGFHSVVQRLGDTVTQSELEDSVNALNEDPSIDGFLVQTPLPDHIDEDHMIHLIDPGKDVDGFHAYNIGRLALRRPTLRSCTPKGVMQLLEHLEVDFYGLDAVILGASNHVGRPMGLELLLAGSTVTTTHKFTRDTSAKTREADLVISAVGKPGLVRGDWIKPGAIVIDVGITRGEDGKLKGDVAFDEVKEVAGWITPVPGGVGPMTRVALLQNTLQAAKVHLGLDA